MKICLMSATIFTFSAPVLGLCSVSEVQCLQYATDTDRLSCAEYVIGGRFHKEGEYKMVISTVFSLCAVLRQFSYFQSYF